MEILATLILVSGVVDDLRSRKVHNKLVLILLAITVVSVLFLSGFSGLMTGGVSFLLALAFGFPLYFARILGAGDVKLFAIFGLVTSTSAVLHVAVFSMVWGAILGVVKSILSGSFKKLILSTTQLLWVRTEGQQQFRIPYTVALLFGWMTYLSCVQMGVLLW